MRLRRYFILALLATAFATSPSSAGDKDTSDASMARLLNAEGYLVILGCSHDYAALLREARIVSRKSHTRIDLMGRTFDAKNEWVSGSVDSASGYWLRNVADGGGAPFISIEDSRAYPGLKKGYFIIVAGIYLSPDEAGVSLAHYRHVVRNAYMAKATIYLGCRS